MLVRTNAASRHPAAGQLDALAGGQLFSSEFKYRRGTEIFGEGEETEYVYQIISGAVRTYKLLSDGRRQINSFQFSGDMFGLENGASHRFTAEAVVETSVCIMRQSSLLDIMAGHRTGTGSLLSLVTRNLEHAETHMLLLGRKTALERVAAFLLEMDQRLIHPQIMILPMSRRDIADYLGVTIETVSRTLSILRDERLLQFEGPTQRRIILLDRAGLAKLEV
jgi:CRP/FNR family transcriptional regulator, nitrogen fixation regulation protein